MKRCYRMTQLVTKLAEKHGFDLYAGDGASLTIRSSGFMPLQITAFAPNIVYVCHYFMQNGDVMYDPEVEFWITPQGDWMPYAWTMPASNLLGSNGSISFGGYKSYAEFEGGKIVRYQKQGQADLASFCTEWATNIRAQGFVDSDDVSNNQDKPVEPTSEAETEADNEIKGLTIIDAPDLPEDNQLHQAVLNTPFVPFQDLPPHQTWSIPQAYGGELTGSISGDVHCYGYATDQGKLVYLNFGGPRMAVEAIRAKLGKGHTISLTPPDVPGMELVPPGSGTYVDYFFNMPTIRFTSVILCHRSMVNQDEYQVSYVYRVSDAQAQAKLYDILHEQVDIALFRVWANWLWEVGWKAGLLRETQGTADIIAITLNAEPWEQLVQMGLKGGVLWLD